MPASTLKEKLHHPWYGGGMGGLLLTLAGVLLLVTNAGEAVRNWSYDLSFLARPPQLIEDVVVVDLGQDSYERLRQSPENFDRGLHAELIHRLQADGAKWIVYDIGLFDERPHQAAGNQRLAAAIRAAGNVVLSAELHERDLRGGTLRQPTMPRDEFRNGAAGVGLFSVFHDGDYTVRQVHPGLRNLPALPWRAAELAGAPVTKPPGAREQPRWLNYYAAHPCEKFSLVAVLSNELPAGFTFRDKAVFVGSGRASGYTGEEKEEFRTPWLAAGREWILGVEIHALTFANLTRGGWLRRWPLPLEWILIMATGLALGLGVSRWRPLAATGLALGIAAAAAGFSLLLTARFETWFPWLIIAGVQVPVALGWSYFLHSMRAYVEAKVLQSSLEFYLSPQQVRQILKTPALLKPGAELKTVSILFSDIAGFSKISERMDPDDLVKLLNNYYQQAIACVHETGGTVMNLIGDAIFAIWNAPQEQPDHQERAARAALLLNQALVKFESNSQSLPLHTRVGLHTGPVCVGNIGSSVRFDYTAIGESVNLASRLEGLNKQLGTNILATRDIQKAVGERLASRLIGHFKFKGFDQVVEVHEMLGEATESGASRPWRESFAAALNRFQRRAFAEAREGFEKTRALHGGVDGPSEFYLERIAAFQTSPPPAEWFGEMDLREK